jgi:hypothetical protein
MAVVFLEVAFVDRFVVSVNGDGLLFPEPIMRCLVVLDIVSNKTSSQKFSRPFVRHFLFAIQTTVMTSSYVVPATDEEIGRKKSDSILSNDGNYHRKINGKLHRTLTTKSSVQDMKEKIEKERCCKRSSFDLWDIISFFLVKLVPCFRSCPCFTSCRQNSDGKHQHMHDLILNSHTGIPVTYDDFTNLMNTVLLMSALLLSFVAGSTTVLGKEQFIENDLTACQRGWAHEQICKKLDVAGYFGDINATWLLTESDLIGNSGGHRRLKVVAGGDGSGVGTSAYYKYHSVDVSGQWFGTWWESPHLTSGQELPSFAIMYYSAWSFGFLVFVVVSGFFHYVVLIISGARQDDSIMQIFWDASLVLIVLDLAAIIAALAFWMQSMCRIVGALWPSYEMHGIEFGWFTHSDTTANYAVLFSAFSLEGCFAWSFVLLVLCILYIVGRTFEAELNYLTTDRPKHIAGFVMKALEHLEDDDCLVTEDTKMEAMSADNSLSNVSGWTSAVYRVVEIFKSQGYKVGGEEWTKEQEKALEGVDKDGNKFLSTAAKEKKIAVQEMEHFIDEFAHLDWKELSIDKDGNKILSVREKACLLRLHSELYTSD